MTIVGETTPFKLCLINDFFAKEGQRSPPQRVEIKEELRTPLEATRYLNMNQQYKVLPYLETRFCSAF